MIEARSSVSETSSVHQLGGVIFDDTDDLELQQRLDKIECEITEMKFENILFESVLERNKAEPIALYDSSATPPVSSFHSVASNGSNPDLTSTGASSRSERLARKRSKSRSTQGDFRIQLTMEQKLDIITSEYEQTKNEKVRRETGNEKSIDQLESDSEWIDVEKTDCELAITDFLKAKDLAIDRSTHKLIGERIDRYFHERIKGRELLKNKLRDRSSGFKRQIVTLDNQIRQDAEMGNTLQEVDFNQLKIENRQFIDKIDEKNIELILLKRQVVNMTQLFNQAKSDLLVKTKSLNDIQRYVDRQELLYARAQQELIIASNEKSRAVKIRSRLVEQAENYRVPEILDYVRKKALLYNLQRECEVWQRKLELISMNLKQIKQQWLALQRAARYQHYANN